MAFPLSSSVTPWLLLDCHNQHGEGVFWNPGDQKLWWTDIHGKQLWAYDPATQHSFTIPVPDRVCSFAPCLDGRFLVAYPHGFAFFDPISQVSELIALVEPDQPTTRLNDGRTDRQGRFIAGGMDERNLDPLSALWSIDHHRENPQLVAGVRCANSTCFSPDGTRLYFADSPTGQIVWYEYDTALGTIGQRHQFAQFQPGSGMPDGSCVDAEGYLWNAVWEGYRIERYTPDGELDRVIALPVQKPTCCAFGGHDLATLFITSSQLFSTPETLAREPGSGGLFALQPGVCGLTDTCFGAPPPNQPDSFSANL